MPETELEFWEFVNPLLKLGWMQWIGAAVFLWGWIHQYRCHAILVCIILLDWLIIFRLVNHYIKRFHLGILIAMALYQRSMTLAVNDICFHLTDFSILIIMRKIIF